MAIQIQMRRDTAANWTSVNPVLAQGEAGLETDTRKIKYGNGSTAWASLAYASNGDVVGPGSAVDNRVAVFDGVTGKLIKDGGHVLSEYEVTSNKSNDIATDAASTTKYPSVKAFKDYADGLVAGLLDYRGAYDAHVNTYPATGGSGTAGAVLKGDLWVISVAGTLGGVAIQVGDYIIANTDTPGQTSSKWDSLNINIAYVPEDQANKVTSISGSSTDVQYPSAKLLFDQLAGKQPTGSYLTSETDPLSLHLDQTTPQTIVNGVPLFNLGIKSPKIYPSADSTTAVRILKADGTSSIITVDTTNSRVGVGGTPTYAKFEIFDVDKLTDTFGNLTIKSTDAMAANKGGMIAFAGNYLTAGGYATFGSFGGKKENATSGNADGYFFFATSKGTTNTERMRIDSNGKVGIGLNAPAYFLDVNGDVNIASGSHFKIGGTNLAYGDISGTPSLTGYVSGPSSAVDAHVAVFDSTTGKIIKDSGVTISGSNTGDETGSTIKTKLGVTTLSGSNTGDQNLFASIPVSGQTTVTPSSASEALTLVAGSGITITTNNTVKSITFSSSGGAVDSVDNILANQIFA